MKVFNTHIEAARYLLGKPMIHKVRDINNELIYVDEYGDFRCGGSMSCYMHEFQLPFTAVEPEKTNTELAESLSNIGGVLDWNLQLLEIMDEKIKKAKL